MDEPTQYSVRVNFTRLLRKVKGWSDIPPPSCTIQKLLSGTALKRGESQITVTS